MASLCPPTFRTPSHLSDVAVACHKLTPLNPTFAHRHPPRLKPQPQPQTPPSSTLFCSHALSRLSESVVCRSHGHENLSPGDDFRWDSVIQQFVKNAIKRFDSFVNSYRDGAKDDRSCMDVEERGNEGAEEDKDWDWDRWRKHFSEVDEQERVVSILKSQLGHAVKKEDYEDAARLKVAIAAAATNDTVGRVMSLLNRAILEERYDDAAFICDSAGAGLVGWWAGISDDRNDPYGRIVHISAEHGRYVARSYSPRQLAAATVGSPLFEIFLTKNKRGEYRQQAVYLKRGGLPQDLSIISSKLSSSTSNLNPLDLIEGKSDLLAKSLEDSEDGEDRDEDSDAAEGLSGFRDILRDMIPGVKVKVLKVTAPGKVDRDLISKVIEQIMEEEEDEQDIELESVETEEEAKVESDQEQDEIEIEAGHESINHEEQNEIAVKVFVGGLVQKLSTGMSNKKLFRVPARLEKKGRMSFTFSIESDDNRKDYGGKGQASLDRKKAKFRDHLSVDHVMFDLAKLIGREKIPMKVLKDVGELINLTLSQAHSRQPLSGSTTFNRIEIPASPDPLNGLYIGSHGLYTSEVIHLRRKFGQWKEDAGVKEPSSLEFYEYVEALKLTGDPYVPAGQVAFRAKVGRRYQLPHKGIIPEEFGVIARYRGQGRLAEPGFRNARWVDGELVILDGKYIKGGPIVGFVYWAPGYHFLVFFNRLMLHE